MASTRVPIIAGNWKMNFTPTEAVALAQALRTALPDSGGMLEQVVCPNMLALVMVADVLKGSALQVGAQDVHWEDAGNYTAQVAAPMVRDYVQYTIIGHSEVRKFLGDDDARVNAKTLRALAHGLKVIVAVGESKEQRDSGEAVAVVSRQVEAALKNVSAEQLSYVVIAYEPVWAIGTGVSAQPADALEIHQAVRRVLTGLYNDQAAAQMRIQYGGSVNPANISSFLEHDDIDGALIGKASWTADSFIEMLNISRTVKGV